MNIFVYTLNILIICSYLLSGIYILLLRGAGPTMRFMLLNRFIGALFGFFILLQVSQTPLYGRALWNPSHVLMSLTLYPMLFLYVFDLLHPGSVTRRLLLFTFLPTVALTALYFAFEVLYGRLPLFAVYADLRNCLNMPQLWVMFAGACFSVALMSFFTVRATGMLRLHKRHLESNFSYKEGSTLGWMWFAIGMALFQWCVVMTGILTEGNVGQMIALFLFTIEPTIVTSLIVRQKDLYGKPDEGKDAGSMPKGNVTELSPEKRKQLNRDLLILLDRDEIFKDPELTIEKMCVMLNTNRTYLWQVINQDMQMTFYRLINSRRFEKSVKMLSDPQYRNFPLSSIAEICGFKTLHAFSACFKRECKKTPTEWRKEALQGDNEPQ